MANGDLGFMGQDWALDAYNPGYLPGAEPYRTPQQEWGRFMAAQPGRAFWQTRAPLEDLGRRLAGQYMLAAPSMISQTADTPVSFSQYIQDYTGQYAPDGAPPTYMGDAEARYGLMRKSAEEAAEAGVTPLGEYMQDFTEGTPDFARRAWRAQAFGPEAENAMANQRAAATALALQRQDGGGVYQGQVANAIRNAMYGLQQYRSNITGRPESFLDWYLGQTG
jgi:hypothetical protein